MRRRNRPRWSWRMAWSPATTAYVILAGAAAAGVLVVLAIGGVRST